VGRLGDYREASVTRTALLSARAGIRPGSVLVYPNVHVGLRGRTRIACAGRLRLERRFNVGRYRESELNLVGDGASLEVVGAFSVYTGFSISVNRGASLTLGSGYIGPDCVIDCFERISIGEGAALSRGLVLRDSDNHELVGGSATSAPIRIGDHVWIGLNAVVLKGVTIGDGAVVAAGAVVTGDVLARTLVAGVPARVLREEVDWR
jgi:acetyltransferase-like isoleucine patch superfamily enzyme